jgi:O-antigen/teichoic acid export membrane protein
VSINYKSYFIPSTEIIAKLFAFINSLIIIRILSPHDFGVYNYIISFGLVLSVLMDGGLNYFAFNSSIKEDNDDLSAVFNTKIILSIVVIISSYFVLYLLNIQYSSLVLVFSFNLLFTTSIAFIKVVARGRNIISADLYSIIGEPVLRSFFLGVLIIFMPHYFNLTKLLISFSVLGLITFIMTLFIINKRINFEFLTKIDLKARLELILKARFYLFYYLCIVFIQRIDIFFINHRLGAELLGLFSSAYNLYLILQLFMVSLIMTRLKTVFNQPERLRNFLLELAALVILVIVFSYLLSESVFELIYPIEYQNSYALFNLLIIALPFYILTSIAIHFNNFSNLSRINAFVLFPILIIKWILLAYYNFTTLTDYIILLVLIEVLLGIVLGVVSRKFYLKKIA